MKFGIKRFKRLVALTAAALTLSSSIVALDLPAAEAATAGTGNCAVTVDNNAGVTTYESGIYCYVAFKSTGFTYTWTKPSSVTNIDLLVVAGGGGGGARHAAGGGAGGLIQLTNSSLTASSMAISVGAGGAGAGYQISGVTANGTNGSNSTVSATGFTTQTAIGGGAGGSATGGGNGGSGGGGPCCSLTAGTATAGQGNAGAMGATGFYNSNQFWVGGAGGGAGAAATAATASAQAGIGGAGLSISWITTAAQTALGVGVTSSSAVYFAGGGGGGTAVYGSGGAGGVGGGGAGGTYNTTAATSGVANTGGGGGGGGYNADNTSPAAGNGGSGVVVIRYIKAAPVVSFNASDINSFDASVSTTAVNDLSAASNNDGVATAQSSGALPGYDDATGAWTFGGGASGYGPYINIPSTISSTPFNTNGMTVDFEADFGASADTWERIADFSAGGASNYNWEVGRSGASNSLFIEFYSGATSIGFCQAANAIPVNSGMNRWTISIDGTNCNMYKNGTLFYTTGFTTKPVAGINWTTNYLARSNWGDPSFEGKIRSFNLYAGAYAPSDFVGYTNKTVTFDSFAGGAATVIQTRLTSGTIKLPTPSARPGYVFTGWFTTSAASTLVGAAGATYTPSATTTLYGGWRTVDSSVINNLVVNWDGTNLASYPAAGTSANSIYPAPSPMAATSVVGTRNTANSPGALTLPGANAAVNFGANNAANITGALTYETWVKFSTINTAAGTWNVIASHWFADTAGTGATDWHFGIYSGKLQVNAGPSNIGIGSKTWTSADVGIWYHLGFSIDSSNNLQIFINGRPDGAPIANMAHAPNASALLWIGDGRNGTVAMNGYVSRARLYNTALSASQIRANFNLETPTFSQTQTFNLTYSAGPNGTGSDVVEFYNSGASATLKNATAPFTRTGYAITGWTTSSTSGAAQTNALSSPLTISGDVTLYPVWGAASNTITYNYNGATGGNGTASSTYTSGGSAITLPTPTKTGYTFGGWYLENTFVTQVTGTQTPSTSYTIYAKWNAGTYTLTYNYNGATGGNGTATSSFTTGGTAITLPTPTKTGYIFGGWYAENTFVTLVSGSQTPSADISLYAKWNAGTYTLTYNYNGATGSNATVSDSFTTGGTAITLPAPTKTGYTFGGWYSDAGLTTAVTGAQSPSASATLYAKWNAATFTLTYNYNGATGGNSSATASYTTGGSAVTLPTPTKTGYTFGGWYLENTFVNQVTGTQTPSSSYTIYAKWNAATFTLTYNYNGATGGNSTATSSFTTGGTAITLPTPTKTGYTFVGWYSDAGLTTLVTGAQSPTTDANLYAKWTAGTYTITYNYNGATGANATVSDSFTTGGTAITLPVPTKTGYTFAGWFSDAGLTAAMTGVQSPTADTTAYAKWNAATFTLTYSYNGATGGNTNATASFTTGGTAITLPTPTKTGYVFGGWYAENTFATLVSGTQTPSADSTLYAKWTAGTYTLTYNYNGATGANGTVSDSFTTGGTAITLPSPTKTGYTFGGWYSDAGLTTSVTGAQSPSSSYTIYAKWNAATFTLTYNYNGATGGNANATASYTTGGATITLPTPTKTGYTFNGWFAEANFTTAVTGAQTPSTDANLYAKFTAINYGLTYNANGATTGAVPVDSSNYIIGSSASVASNSGNLVRTGYTFAGWTLASNGSGTVYTSGQALIFGASAQVLYAKWTANTYTIGYNVNGATGAQANASDSYTTGGSAVTLSAVGTMTKTGYTFAGWSTSAGGSVLTGTFTTTADVTLYAIWTVNVITVTYSKGAASSASFISFPANTSGNYATRITISNTIDSSVTFNSSTYAFVGWSDGTSLYQSGQQYLLGASNVTLTAVWVQAYGVRYIFNGGTPANGTSPIDAECLVVGNLCTDQQRVTANIAPTRDGYTFTGWVDQSANAIAAGSTFTVTINSYLLYAQWTANNYAITYVPNGGATTPTQSALHYGDTFTIANAITRTGYTFGGWSDGVSTYGAGATYTVGLSPITLTAVFTPKTYVITYDWNGGTGSAVANVNYTVGNAGATLATVGDHVKDGYQFGGWALTVGGDAVASPFVATDNTTLYAIWGSGSYSLTFEQNYGVSTSSNISVANGTSTVLPTLTRNNFVFDGWYSAAVGGTKVGNGGASYTPSASRQLYAHWIQSSLYGIAPGNLSRVSTITASSSIDSTYSGTNGGSGVSVTVPRGSLPAGTVINLDMITDTSYAQSLVSGTNNYILALAVSWLALDETVPNTNGSTSISLTLTNSNIRAGALIYSVQNGVATLLGTATSNGTLTVQLTADPGIYVVQTVPTVARTISSTATTTSAVVTWTAPLSDGGATITGYTVTLNNGMTCTTATLTCTFNNLTTGTSYTASVVATNSVGSSVAGTVSFTPTAPVVAPPTPTPPTPQPPVPPTPQPPVDPIPSKPVVVVVPVVEAIAKVLANNVPVLNGTPVVSPIQFNADSAKLDATDLASIKKAAAALEGKSGVLLITGFVKYTGKSSAAAKALAQSRAKNVATALAKLGVKVKLGYVGYGPRNTANPSNTDRKVELRWIAVPVSNS